MQEQFLLPRRMDSSSILIEIDDKQEVTAQMQKFQTTRPIIMPKTNQTNLLDLNSAQDDETLVAEIIAMNTNEEQRKSQMKQKWTKNKIQQYKLKMKKYIV